MWNVYSRSYLTHNRAARRTVTAAALAAAFFLSLVCSLFYNLWAYEVERILLEEGGWQARITVAQSGGALDETLDETLETLNQFANVETAAVNTELSADGAAVIDLAFRDKGGLYADLDRIESTLGLPAQAVQTHDTLLSRYLVNDPQDPSPSLLMPFYLAVLAAVVLALVLLIRNSFEITMQARLRQLGILASIGATPRQIRACLLQEAAALAVLPLLGGTVLGCAACWAVLAAVNAAAAHVEGRMEAVFQLHPLLVVIILLLSLLTVLLSAWLPARRLSRMTPLEALRGGAAASPALRWKHRKHARLLALCFGIRGELAGNALRTQKHSLRIANVSLLLSFLGFTAMLCFFTLSGISTQMTYFARYQDAWDIMAALPQTSLTEFSLTGALRGLPGVENCTAYEKAEASCYLPAEAQSEELLALGGLPAVAGSDVAAADGGWLVDAPIVVLDDDSFLAYCEDAGIEPSLDGAVLLNRVWDNLHSNFRDRLYVPFVAGDTGALTLTAPDGAALGELPLLGSTDAPPVLREEYDQYTLVQFWPQSLWQKLGQAWGLSPDADGTTVRILGRDGITREECRALQADVSALLEQNGYAFTVENRIDEKIANDEMVAGMQGILGAFCLLLAAIGLANVFLNTLGFVQQRRREFARYLSIGMTPRELRSLFWIEGAAVAGRPLIITLPLTALVGTFMLQASYLDPAVFLAQAPILPVVLFALLIVGTVALAYFLGARKVLTDDLAEVLKDESLR
ncbi:MAG: FtsX-like permease family protein [Blautia massiliensis (ex Durand et al. 2017)]